MDGNLNKSKPIYDDDLLTYIKCDFFTSLIYINDVKKSYT